LKVRLLENFEASGIHAKDEICIMYRKNYLSIFLKLRPSRGCHFI